MGEARELGERWFETVTRGDPDAVEALLTEDCDFITPGGSVTNAAEAAQFLRGFAQAFPDASFAVSRWIEDGEAAAAEGVYRGTHTGPLEGPQGTIPATGRPIEVPFVTVFLPRDGRIAAHHAYWDNAIFMAQPRAGHLIRPRGGSGGAMGRRVVGAPSVLPRVVAQASAGWGANPSCRMKES